MFTAKQLFFKTPPEIRRQRHFMSNHPELTSGKFSSSFTVKHAQNLWAEVTGKLHEIPGAFKTWQQWRKTWQDIRSKVKAKNTMLKNHRNATGGGPASNEILTQTDENVMAIMGTTVIDGHDGIAESSVEFDWSSSAPNADPASEIQCLSDDYEFVENFIKANGCNVPVLPERVTKTIHSTTIRNRAAENRVTEIRKMTPLQHISDSTPSTSSQEDTLLIEAEHPGSSNSAHNLHNGMHSVPKKRCQRKMAAVQRLEKSITQADQLAIISQKDQESREIYYQRKLELYERDVIAKEKIAHSLEELVKNFQ